MVDGEGEERRMTGFFLLQLWQDIHGKPPVAPVAQRKTGNWQLRTFFIAAVPNCTDPNLNQHVGSLYEALQVPFPRSWT